MTKLIVSFTLVFGIASRCYVSLFTCLQLFTQLIQLFYTFNENTINRIFKPVVFVNYTCILI